MRGVHKDSIGLNRYGISPKSQHGRVKPPSHRIEDQAANGQIPLGQVLGALLNGDEARAQLLQVAAVRLGLLLIEEAAGDLLAVAPLVG